MKGEGGNCTVKAGTRDAAQDPSCGCTVCVLTHVCHRWWTARGVNSCCQEGDYGGYGGFPGLFFIT